MKIGRTPKRTALLLPFIWRMLAIKHLQSNMYHWFTLLFTDSPKNWEHRVPSA